MDKQVQLEIEIEGTDTDTDVRYFKIDIDVLQRQRHQRQKVQIQIQMSDISRLIQMYCRDRDTKHRYGFADTETDILQRHIPNRDTDTGKDTTYRYY